MGGGDKGLFGSGRRRTQSADVSVQYASPGDRNASAIPESSRGNPVNLWAPMAIAAELRLRLASKKRGQMVNDVPRSGVWKRMPARNRSGFHRPAEAGPRRRDIVELGHRAGRPVEDQRRRRDRLTLILDIVGRYLAPVSLCNHCSRRGLLQVGATKTDRLRVVRHRTR